MPAAAAATHTAVLACVTSSAGLGQGWFGSAGAVLSKWLGGAAAADQVVGHLHFGAQWLVTIILVQEIRVANV